MLISWIVFTDGVDDLEASTPLVQKRRDDFWWMLQISVHRNHDVPTTMIQAGEKRWLVTKITREADVTYAVVSGAQRSKDIHRFVRAAIVGNEQLEVGNVLKNRGDPVIQQR